MSKTNVHGQEKRVRRLFDGELISFFSLPSSHLFIFPAFLNSFFLCSVCLSPILTRTKNPTATAIKILPCDSLSHKGQFHETPGNAPKSKPPCLFVSEKTVGEDSRGETLRLDLWIRRKAAARTMPKDNIWTNTMIRPGAFND